MAVGKWKLAALVALAAICIGMSACGGQVGAMAGSHSTSGRAGNLTGQWQFSMQGGRGDNNTETVEMVNTVTLSNTGGVLSSAPMDFPGLPSCGVTQVQIADGSETGTQVSWEFQEGGALPQVVQVMEAQGTVGAGSSSMSGTWGVVMDGACMNAGAIGTWSAVRVGQ
jgi:hypothetical protein